jgi:hypothetical protein
MLTLAMGVGGGGGGVGGTVGAGVAAGWVEVGDAGDPPPHPDSIPATLKTSNCRATRTHRSDIRRSRRIYG